MKQLLFFLPLLLVFACHKEDFLPPEVDIPGIEMGKVAHWTFDGTTDESISGRYATIAPETYTADRHDVMGNALHFDGNTPMRIDDAAGYQFGVGEDYTTLAWVKPSAELRDHGMYIMAKGNADAVDINRTVINNFLGIIDYRFEGYDTLVVFAESIPAGNRNPSSPACHPDQELSIGVVTASDKEGQYLHIAHQRKSGYLRIFVNGTLISEVPEEHTSACQIENDQPLYFGKIENGNMNGFRPFNGEIDDIQIFNRALTDAEILTLSNL